MVRKMDEGTQTGLEHKDGMQAPKTMFCIRLDLQHVTLVHLIGCFKVGFAFRFPPVMRSLTQIIHCIVHKQIENSQTLLYPVDFIEPDMNYTIK